jgi:hypothetical protein
MDFFGELVKIGGLPLALVAMALIAVVRGDVVVKRSYDAMVAEKDRQILDCQERAKDLWGIVRPSLHVGYGALTELEAGGKTQS